MFERELTGADRVQHRLRCTIRHQAKVTGRYPQKVSDADVEALAKTALNNHIRDKLADEASANPVRRLRAQIKSDPQAFYGV